jgi:hypothetical protein
MKKEDQPVLRHILNLWTLWDHPTAKKPWSLDRQLAEIKQAGFDGFTTQANSEHGRLAEKHGLMIIGFFSSGKSSDFRRLIEENRQAGATHINVQLADHDTLTDEALRLTLKLMKESERLGATCAVEVHRDTCTETPEKTYALAAAYEKATGRLLPLTWDFSHLAVVKHLAPPFAKRLLVDAKLIQHAQQFHFRPFNGHHGQVPVTDGRGKLSPELVQWLPFMEECLKLCLQVPQAHREIFAVPEMGPIPGGYSLSSFPNSWEDAKVLRTLIAKAWKKALAARR